VSPNCHSNTKTSIVIKEVPTIQLSLNAMQFGIDLLVSFHTDDSSFSPIFKEINIILGGCFISIYFYWRFFNLEEKIESIRYKKSNK